MTKRGAETSGEKDAGRLAVCVICVTYTVDRPVPRCETHNRHPTYCIRALQSELAAAKAKHDEELAARRRRSDLALGIVQKERDAALARVKELEYWRNGSWAMKALDKARSEAEALRAGIVLAIREIKGRYDTEDDAPMWISAVVNDLARLAPAPAPCKHSWMEEENEADQRQTICEKCGVIKPAPAPECDHAASFGVFVGGKLLCRVCDMPAPAPAPM